MGRYEGKIGRILQHNFLIPASHHGIIITLTSHPSLPSLPLPHRLLLQSYAKELYYTQQIDHFSPTPPTPSTYQQRYFVNSTYYTPSSPNSTIFFYFGNEANVELYLNATGLMWENAPSFSALLVFCEHRYYGLSTPFGDDMMDNLSYLTVEQALADYVSVIGMIKEEYSAPDSTPVIGFGGSYGGMLATWGRIAYPEVFAGVVAASAPVVTFEGMEPAVEPGESYAEGVTYDVTDKAGVEGECETNLRAAFEELKLTEMEPKDIVKGLRLCEDGVDLDTIGWDATNWVNEALSYMAMGNFPYPSSYILNGNGVLPAFPVREACKSLEKDLTGEGVEWLEGIRGFADVYYNYTKDKECFELQAPVNEEVRGGERSEPLRGFRVGGGGWGVGGMLIYIVYI